MRGYVLLSIAVMGLGYTLAGEAQVRIPTESLERFNPAVISTVREVAEGADAPAESRPRTASNEATLERLRRLQLGADPSLQVVDPGAASVPDTEIELARGEYVLIKSMDPPREIACSRGGAGECIESEFRFVTTTMQEEVVSLSLAWESTRQLRFSDTTFTGDLFVHLRDSDAPNAVKRLSGAIQVVVAAPVDEVAPGQILEFDQTNRFQQVSLSVRSPQEPTLVRLSPAASADSHEVTFDVDRPRLQLSIGQDSLLGFGLETASVSVRAATGSLPAGAHIAITSSIGKLDRNDVPFENGRASTFVRSRGLGSDTITASLAPFVDAVDTIEYRRPWTWLFAVLAGAVFGITIRLVTRSKAPTGEHGVTYNIAIGATGAVVTAVLYALGVNILPLPLPGGFSEGATFVLSTLGAWIFPKWLGALTPAQPAA